jgi:hypothetical protein
MERRTTSLDELDRGGGKFTWGEVVRWYSAGPYVILEYHPWMVEGVTVRTGFMDPGAVSFHVWVNRRSTSEAFSSLDAALAGAIAYRNEGPNHRADFYFIQGIQVEPVEKASTEDVAKQLDKARTDIRQLTQNIARAFNTKKNVIEQVLLVEEAKMLAEKYR